MSNYLITLSQNGAICKLIAIFLTNQNAGNTIDFKINEYNKNINDKM